MSGKEFKTDLFTRREAECMALLLQDKKNIGIAKDLGLSARTTEYYFAKIKQRLGLSTKSDLIEKIMQSDF